MSKYNPLREFLAARAGNTVTLTFAQIDELVGTLPASAHKYQVWWHNNDPSHQHCQSWGDVGYIAPRTFAQACELPSCCVVTRHYQWLEPLCKTSWPRQMRGCICRGNPKAWSTPVAATVVPRPRPPLPRWFQVAHECAVRREPRRPTRRSRLVPASGDWVLSSRWRRSR